MNIDIPKSVASRLRGLPKLVQVEEINKRPSNLHVFVIFSYKNIYLCSGRLVWAKLPGYPWWPSMICNHPTTGKCQRKREVHVQFFDDPVTRSWIDKDLIKPWSEKVILFLTTCLGKFYEEEELPEVRGRACHLHSPP